MDKTRRSKILVVLKVLVCLALLFFINKSEVISVPNEDEMISFQFDLITVATIFAGFSFTVLGMLLGMFSEPMMKKLKDTSIVTCKSRQLMKSIISFCISVFFSLVFILGCDQYIITIVPKCGNIIVWYLFAFCVLFLIVGIKYFVASTIGVFKLISKIYGNNMKKYETKKENYQREKESAKEKLKIRTEQEVKNRN